METIHPFLDEAIGEYALGAHNIFYIGVWFVANAFCKDAANPRKLSFRMQLLPCLPVPTDKLFHSFAVNKALFFCYVNLS